ncbi:peptidyl-prolyl cis-trans isomerase FKBP4-like [Liolophura sinensis]|uniref:peptidyl-prolyl cis-trans isomerase FKBP4-like n=1 Tax=Liolophura sinensis TaxID=3198878 RepID=UPI003158B15F
MATDEIATAMESESVASDTTTATEDNGIDLTPNKDGGVLKKILREGTGSETPGKGDTVYVHYVGTLLDGTKFDSSRDRNELFDFKLGMGSVIKAWDIGVASMKKGELALLTCKPEYAYGESGSGPVIGPNATLVFEVELFRWEGEDISEERDGGVTRRVIRKGEGYKTPNEGATVDVHITGRYNDAIFDDRNVQFILGEGEELDICPGLEQALKKFVNKEHSKLWIKSKHAFGKEGSAKFNIPPDADIVYEVEMTNFEKAKEAWEMDTAEKLNQSELVKQKGTDFFKAGKYKQAINYYKKIVKFLETESALEGEETSRHKSLLLAAHLNLAMCQLKLQDYQQAEKECENALEIDAKNEKGLFRRGMARLKQNEYESAIEDFREVLKIDPNNKAARKELSLATQKLKQFRDKEKKLYAGMFTKLAAKEEKLNTNEVNGTDSRSRSEGHDSGSAGSGDGEAMEN